jgi:phosphoglycerate kinase
MNKKTLRDVDVKGRRVLMRVDFNVPIKDGKVADDTRITAALPSIQHVLDGGGSLVLMSHLGRPKGKGYEAEFSLKPAAEHLQKVLGKPVLFGADCIGAETIAQAQAMKPGQVMLVENTRFYKEEEGKAKVADDASDAEKKAAKEAMKAKQTEFTKTLAALGDGEIYCNDAFGSAHRAHASTAVVCAHYKQNVAGFLMEKEIEYLGGALEKPQRPFVAVLGGAKVSDKVAVITNLLEKVDALIIGGAMAYTFYRAQGIPTGKSLVEEDKVELAKELLAKAKAKGVALLLPVDHVIADAFAETAKTEVVGEKGIRDGWMALDVGPASAGRFAGEIRKAKTVVWNGPMGCFEMKPFAAGTLAIATALAETKCLSIVGGGDSVSAVNKSGLAPKMTHISTGGGASLEFLEGKVLPGVKALTDR